MTTRQYIRKASLIVGPDSGDALDLSELRFSFAVRRGDNETPNSADIRVFNISPKASQTIQKEFTRVVLQAGYEGNFGVIFDGQIKQVRRGRASQTDTYLDITAADGDRAYNYSVMAVSLAAGSSGKLNQVQEVLKALAAYGVYQGYLPDLDNSNLPRGKVMFGMTRDELRTMAKNALTNWSIQNGKLQMVPESAYLPGEVPVITSETGLVGLPEQMQNGIGLKVLLNPSIKIGQAIKIDNESLQKYRFSLALGSNLSNELVKSQNKVNNDGLYYVMVADHYGDTRGNDWYSELTCLAIDATGTLSYSKRMPVGTQSVSMIKRNG